MFKFSFTKKLKEVVKTIKFFDCFAGIGGFRSGLEKADGFECVGFCEIDKYAAVAYKAIYDTKGEDFRAAFAGLYRRAVSQSRSARNV